MAALVNISTRSPEPSVEYIMQVETARAVLPDHLESVETMEDLGFAMGKWDAGLCVSCSSLVPNCLMSFCCLCVTLAQIGHRLNVAPSLAILLLTLPAIGFKYLAVVLALYYQIRYWASDNDFYYYRLHALLVDFRVFSVVFDVCICIFVWRLRHLTRERFRIPGSYVKDCVASFCCSCCVAAQIAIHTKTYQPHTCSFGTPDALPGYK